MKMLCKVLIQRVYCCIANSFTAIENVEAYRYLVRNVEELYDNEGDVHVDTVVEAFCASCKHKIIPVEDNGMLNSLSFGCFAAFCC